MYAHNHIWDVITHTYPTFKGGLAESALTIWTLMSNYTPQFFCVFGWLYFANYAWVPLHILFNCTTALINLLTFVRKSDSWYLTVAADRPFTVIGRTVLATLVTQKYFKGPVGGHRFLIAIFPAVSSYWEDEPTANEESKEWLIPRPPPNIRGPFY